jgi:hypothetical protein
MDNTRCEWVRGRLPLWVGEGNDAHEDGGDLSAEDRRTIGDHLRGCPECLAHRMGLERALDALAFTAGTPPIGSGAASLWPSLERRIGGHPPGHESRPPRVWEAVAAAGPVWTGLDDERPLRSAWRRDSLREMAEAAGLGVLSDRSGGARRARRGTWRVVGASLAASILVSLIVLPMAWRRQQAAEAAIIANAAPAPSPVGPPAPAASAMMAEQDPEPDEDRNPPADELARADSIRPPADPAPAADARAGARSEPPVRFGYDLDHGWPMPQDGRDKPVY